MDAKKHKFVKTMDASAEKTWQAMKKKARLKMCAWR